MTPEQLAEIRARYTSPPAGPRQLVADLAALLAHVEALEAAHDGYAQTINAALLEESRRLRARVAELESTSQTVTTTPPRCACGCGSTAWERVP